MNLVPFIPFFMELILKVIGAVIDKENENKKKKGKLKKKEVMDSLDLLAESGAVEFPKGLEYATVRPFISKLIDKAVKMFNKTGLF